VVCRKSSGNFETVAKWSVLPCQVGIGGGIGREIAKERREDRRASNCGLNYTRSSCGQQFRQGKHMCNCLSAELGELNLASIYFCWSRLV
jgi:hypothetical protein